jgi:hypothetical protein
MNFQKKIMKGFINDLIDANLIDHEYIERFFLFNKTFMQKSFYIFMIGKFG